MEDKHRQELREAASISIMNALLETTKHSVIEEPAIKGTYAKVAVKYADTLLDELEKDGGGNKSDIPSKELVDKVIEHYNKWREYALTSGFVHFYDYIKDNWQ